MRTKIAAKLNLHLSVTGKSGNLHTLDSVMASVNVYDDVSVKRSARTVVLQDGVLQDETNSAHKAISAFEKAYGKVSVKVKIKKRIPFSAGLGGSSADGAAVLFLLSKLYGRPITPEIALSCGSDVFFTLHGGVARISSVGEKLEPLPFFDCDFLVVKPREGVSTALAYKTFDDMALAPSPFPTSLGFASQEEISEFFAEAQNDLFLPAAKLSGEIAKTQKTLSDLAPEKVLMSGSGSAFFALFETKEKLKAAFRSLKRNPDFEFVKIVKTVPSSTK